MEFEKLNFLTIVVFLIIFLGIWYLIYLYYKQKKLLSKKIFLLRKISNIKYLLLILSFLLVLFTIFAPRAWLLESKWQAKGVDIVFTLDVSKSMNVADIDGYTRLDVAKWAIANFVSKHTQDRFGLVIFAWDAVSSVPLTLDHDVFLTFLKGVDYRNILKQGTDLKKAVKLAVNRFDFNDDRSKAVVIVSDGADPDYKIDINYFKNLKKKYPQIHFFVVGIWTEKWWRIIKWTDLFWRPLYQKYKWSYVISKINKQNLQLLASALDAKYIEVSNTNDLEKLSKDFEKMEKKVLYSNSKWEKNDITRILVILSFILFSVYLWFDTWIIYFVKSKVLWKW